MATIGIQANNPGDLQAVGGSAFQGATHKSLPAANGAKIEVFDNLTDGIRALAIDLGNAINKGYNTVSSLVYHYLGTKTNNAQNPNVQGYLADVEQQTGLSSSSSVSSSNVPSLVSAIINAEGNSSGVSQSALQQGLSAAGYTTGASTVTGTSSTTGINLSTIVQSEYNNFASGLNAFATNPSGAFSYLANNAAAGTAASIANPQAAGSYLLGQFTSGASTVADATSATGAQIASAATSPFASIGSFFTNITSTSVITRVVLVLLGVILVAAAIFAFAKPNVNLNDVAKLAPLAA